MANPAADSLKQTELLFADEREPFFNTIGHIEHMLSAFHPIATDMRTWLFVQVVPIASLHGAANSALIQ